LNLLQKPKYESLTRSEIEILDAVAAEHFNRSTDDLVDWCHSNCPEYEEVPLSKRKPIELASILKSEGKSEAQIEKIEARAEELSELQELLG